MARGGTARESGLLLCRGDRCAQSQSASRKARSREGCFQCKEGYHCNLVPIIDSLERDDPCFIIVSSTDAEETRGVRNGFAVSGFTLANCPTPARFWCPSSGTKAHACQSCKIPVPGWSSTSPKACHQTVGPEANDRGRARGASMRMQSLRWKKGFRFLRCSFS